MQDFLRNLRRQLLSRDIVVLWLVLAIFLSLTGPFGSYTHLTLGMRILFWVPILTASIVFATSIRVFVAQVKPDWPFGYVEAVSVPAFSLLFSVPLWWMIWLFSDPGDPTRWSLVTTFVVVALISACSSAMRQILRSLNNPTNAGPRLTERLADGAAKVVRMTVDDHYVEVYLADGRSERLLMRFADAIAEMDGVRGFSTHRSHWVAQDAIDTTVRRNGRDFLRLVDGAEIPVSRKFRPALVAAGYFAETGGNGKGAATAVRPVRTAIAGRVSKPASASAAEPRPPV